MGNGMGEKPRLGLGVGALPGSVLRGAVFGIGLAPYVAEPSGAVPVLPRPE